MRTESIRETVKMAFTDLQIARAGILGVQLEMMESSASGRYTERPSRIVVSEGSEIKWEVEPVRYREGKKYKTSSPQISELDMALTSWRRAIYSSNGPFGAWLRYVYAKDINFQHQVDICSWIYSRYEQLNKAAGGRKPQKTTAYKLRKLVWLVAQELTQSIRHQKPYDDVKWSDEEISAMMKMPIKTWQRRYSEKRYLIYQSCCSLDAESLMYAIYKREEIIESNRN